MPYLLDTGPLYALADRSDGDHKAVKAFFVRQKEVMILPWVILPELAYLLKEHLGDHAEMAFVHSLNQRELTLEGVHDQDLKRAEGILLEYPEFGFVDAVVMAMAERPKIKKIITFDHRDFQRFRPVHCAAFELYPQ